MLEMVLTQLRLHQQFANDIPEIHLLTYSAFPWQSNIITVTKHRLHNKGIFLCVT